jgi:asparagine synthetase B (glutamine-hydrolysing)
MPDFFGSYSTLPSASLLSHHSNNPLSLHSKSSWFSEDHRVCLSSTPVFSSSGTLALVFKGQIYNHLEIRCGLRYKSWRTDSAIETLVEGLSQRGPALLLDLRGMFVFAAYDYTREQLLLGRDRVGLEALYICWQPSGIQFSSDSSSLSSSSSLSTSDHLYQYNFALTNVAQDFPGPEVKGVQTFPSGVVVRLNHSRPHDPVRYWPSEPRPDWTALPIRTLASATSFLRRQLDEVIRYHLSAAPDSVCLLSPDVGSFCLTALVSRINTVPTHTLTVSLPGDAPSFLEHISELTSDFSSIHESIVITEDQALSWLHSSLSTLEPSSLLNTRSLLVSRVLSEYSKCAVLSSCGSDELFGIQPYPQLSFMIHCLSIMPSFLRFRFFRSFNSKLFPYDSSTLKTDWFSLFNSLSQRSDPLQSDVLSIVSPVSLQSSAIRITQSRGKRTWIRLFASTEPLILRQLSALGSHYHVHHSFPFLDHRIVELALRIPQRFHRSRYGLLFNACHDLFPRQYHQLAFNPCSLPMKEWMLGPLRSTCLSRIRYLYNSDHVDHDWLRGQWQAFEASQLSWSRIWTLVVLGESFRRSSS